MGNGTTMVGLSMSIASRSSLLLSASGIGVVVASPERNKWTRVDSLDVDDDLEVVEGMEGSGVGGKGAKDAEM